MGTELNSEGWALGLHMNYAWSMVEPGQLVIEEAGQVGEKGVRTSVKNEEEAACRENGEW